jgi:hypothetical protein
MYTDFMLRFDTEAEATATLYEQVAVAFDDEGAPTDYEPRAKFRNIDTIGTIYTGGEWDADGNVLVEPVALPGWHVNVRALDGEDTSGLDAFEVHPASPVRVWA